MSGKSLLIPKTLPKDSQVDSTSIKEREFPRLKSSSRKILIVVNDPAFFISHRLPIAIAARKAGYKVLIASPEGEGVLDIRKNGFEFHQITLSRWGMKPGEELRSLWHLYKLYKKLKPDLVHHVTIKPILYGSIAARMARVPAVINAFSGLGYLYLSKGAIASLRRFILKPLFKIGMQHRKIRAIFQNQDDLTHFQKETINLHKKTTIINGCGVNTDSFAPQAESSGKPLVLMVARLLQDKGIAEFVSAARLLKELGHKARFVVVGPFPEGNPAAITKSTLEVWKAEGVVEFWGAREDIVSCYKQAHIVCLPSYREGFSKVLLEAAACARPIVTTNVAGCRQLVRDNVNGYLVPPRDSLALAKALESLIINPVKRVQMGAAGRLIVEAEKLSEQDIAQETLNLYQELLLAH